MAEENISQEIRLNKKDETRKLFHWRNKTKWLNEQEVKTLMS